ncbi:hypothetical protein EG68_01410 [Paragonimus skrjabini miyazakii]|uniref:Uncharacterized protein n=1 Tax=Paragonimus skrjabini miyazakii TaxID=59628 RepID=A0A8S9ZBY4_9TREM|nr:hypothetical protein EG68_01410 [Paragonimus skrjabini miyazakii]
MDKMTERDTFYAHTSLVEIKFNNQTPRSVTMSASKRCSLQHSSYKISAELSRICSPHQINDHHSRRTIKAILCTTVNTTGIHLSLNVVII